MRHREKQAIQLRHKQRRPRTRGCRDARDSRRVRRAIEFKRVDGALAPTYIEALAGDIVKQIIGVADDVEGTDLLTHERVVHQDFRRIATTDKETMTGL